jgi:hypothetical protein
MNGMRKLLCFLLAGALAAFALPSLAASTTKYFYAYFPQVVLNTGPAPASENISFTIFNSTPPPGVSTINSMEIDAPAGVTINSISNGTLSSQGGGHYIVNNMTGIKSGQSKTLTLNVTVDGPNCVQEAWGIFANAGNAYPQGDSFTDQHPAAENLTSAVGCDGTLVCNTPLSDLNPTLDGSQHSVLGRGAFDADGSSCSTNAVPYSADFITLNSQTFNFKEISNGQHPTIEYVLSWNPKPITSTWPNFQPSVAWLNQDGSPSSQPGTPQFIPALVCLSDDLNNPTGIMPTMPAVSPYSDAPYYADGTKKAKMCIAEQGWAVVNGQIQFWDRVIDQGDGFVSGP